MSAIPSLRRRSAPLLGLLLLASPALAQEGQKIHEVSGEEPDPRALIEMLTPENARGLTRGVRVEAAQEAPSCAVFRSGGSRGISVQSADTAEPISDIAALKIRFELNSATLSSESTPTLDAIGMALSAPQLSGYCFRIEGHTCDLGDDAYNKELSRKRALSVQKYLSEKYDIEEERLIVSGYGEAKPLVENVDEEQRSRNRRVQIANLGTGRD